MTGLVGTSSANERGATVLGAAAIILAGFVFGTSLPTEFRFVNIGPIGAGILVAGGVLAIVSDIVR